MSVNKSNNSAQFYGKLAVFFCATLWSTSGLFIKLIDAHPFVIAGLRSFIAAILMISIRLAFPRRSSGPAAESLKKTMRIPAFWFAGFAYAAVMILFVIANKLTASANVILLQYSAPAWAAIFAAILLHEKPAVENWISLIMVAGGLVLFFKDALAAGSLLGDILAVVSGIALGANSVLLKMIKDGNPADGMLLAHIITAVVGIPFLILFPFAISGGATGALLFMGIFQVGFASILYSYGIQRISSVAALIIACIEPVLNPVWVLIVTGEKPALSAIIGGAIIIAAVLVSTLTSVIRKR
ncbi:membrane protein [Spirochaetia bacterium]|nr:membrane protein [Spirochaetia bacterium]